MNELKSANTPDKNSVFLASGGGKGITAKNVIALADRYGCEFILLGRSRLLDEEPDWAGGCHTEADLKENAIKALKAQGKKPTPREVEGMVRRITSSREIQSTLEAVRDHGGAATYKSADITDAGQLREALEGHRGRITGLLHGAGALADKYIEEKEERDFDLVYGVKVDGLRHMLSLVPPRQLEFIILFSSVAGFYGNVGQADYALGNEVLNKIGHHLQTTLPDTRVLVVDWGPWDGGMVTPQLKRILARRDVDVIPISRGTGILLDLLENEERTPQWVVGSPLPQPPSGIDRDLKIHRIHRQLTLENNPFLADHVIGGKAVLPTVCAVGWMINGCEGLYPGYTFHEVDDYRVFKGIVFDDSLADDYVVRLEEQHKTRDEITLQGRIQSEGDNLARNHYQATISLVRDLPDPPERDLPRDLEKVTLSGSDLYGEQTLFHGPRFQGVQEVIHHSREKIITRCRLPAMPAGEQGQFPADFYNPYLTDAHLQSLLIWASLYRDVKGLPLRIANGKQYRPLPFDTNTFVLMDVESITKHTLLADVTSFDAEGRIYSEVTGAEITLSERLNELFLENQLQEMSR